MRLVEIALLLLPFGVFLAWRMLAPAGGPPRGLLLGMTAATLLMAAALVALRLTDTAPPDSVYIPAHEENGQIIPPRFERAAPGR